MSSQFVEWPFQKEKSNPAGCGQWIAGVANLWRTTGDVQATWQSVMGNIHAQNNMAAVARPGHFNDPDMLEIGNLLEF